jgi:uncharacterized protein YutD
MFIWWELFCDGKMEQCSYGGSYFVMERWNNVHMVEGGVLS